MKLSPLTIFFFAISISAVILCLGYFQHWAPKTAEAANFKALQEQLETIGAQLPKQKKNVDDATQLRNEAAAQWQSIVLRKTPPSSVEQGGINLGVNRFHLINDAVRFRNNIQMDVNRQLKVGGVRVLSGVRVPPFPDNSLTIIEEGFNYPRLGFPARVYDFGTIRVEGSMEQIRRNVESWSNMPNYLAVVDGLRIDGTPPKLIGSYNLSLVMYIRAKDIYPPVPEVPGAEAPAGGSGPIGGIGGGGGGGGGGLNPTAPAGGGGGGGGEQRMQRVQMPQ
ncbi:MAG: hypothetical protein JNK63_06185 [Chthonomonas sp.]|nr:hypothetical protein [Chthonomonas sp.]